MVLLIGMILITSPRISKADDDAVVQKSAIEQFRLWSPPSVAYSLSTIGRNIEYEGEQLRCYTVQEGKSALTPIFADYRSMYRMSWLAVAAMAEYQAKVSALNTKLTLSESMIAFYRDESDNWYKVSQSKEKLLESKERWSWVPWSMLVAASCAFGITGIASASK